MPEKETDKTEKFEEWALLELFGHQRLAGRVTEQQLGGASFVRVDVPQDEPTGSGAKKKKPWKLTRLYNPSAIYSVTPVTEETARLVARSIAPEPVSRWDIAEMVKQSKLKLQAASSSEDPFEDAG